MVMAGRLNIRALDDRFLDMPDVTEEDWEDESDDQLTQFGLAPISSLEKSFLVHYSRLARICMPIFFSCVRDCDADSHNSQLPDTSNASDVQT